jgi:hypothetical protein
MLNFALTITSAMANASLFLGISLYSEAWSLLWFAMIAGATIFVIGGAACVVDEYKEYQSARRGQRSTA